MTWAIVSALTWSGKAGKSWSLCFFVTLFPVLEHCAVLPIIKNLYHIHFFLQHTFRSQKTIKEETSFKLHEGDEEYIRLTFISYLFIYLSFKNVFVCFFIPYNIKPYYSLSFEFCMLFIYYECAGGQWWKCSLPLAGNPILLDSDTGR